MNLTAATCQWGQYRLTGWQAVWLKMLHCLPPGCVWRRIALWLRKPLKCTMRDLVDVEVWGLKLRLHSRGNLSEQRLLLMPQFLDALERDVLARELKVGDVLLDIGANAGVYSLWVASRCEAGVRVEAFEPDPELCRRLRFNLQTNGLTRVTLHEYALGRTTGEATLVTGHGNRGENRITTGAAPGQRVQVASLPEVLRENGITRVKALKIDVEGFEVDVLSPLFEKAEAELLPELIVCELTSHVERTQLHHLLAQHGYQLEARGRLNGIYRLPVH
jgi:FkbM family methyltransferase